ncbi:hypothetical protein G7Y89_g2451 [Cudoniella acicularis]|uniref:Uncharacterized protein n=1 Tax=Cudoniella acicularis TaxID=354080 RepID=A0A8H4W9C6_9HELO|nr:hypothetical protein G7Y89_g2451 [Cudoniella acicularis]
MATTMTHQATPAALPEKEEKTETQSLSMHKDSLSANTLDLKDQHVSAALGLFAIHNVLRRTLFACAQHAKNVSASNTIPFICYSSYTLNLLKEQLQSVDTVWFPKFSEYDGRFREQIRAHEPIVAMVTELEELLEPQNLVKKAVLISEKFEEIHKRVNLEFDIEEILSNELGHRVPMDEIRGMEKNQEERRAAQVKIYGHLWSAVYLLRALSPKERAIFPPGIPKVVMSGMLTAGNCNSLRNFENSNTYYPGILNYFDLFSSYNIR